MGRLRQMVEAFPPALEQMMDMLGSRVCRSMRAHYKSYSHPYETGALYNSIRHETHTDDDLVTVYVFADAKSDDDIPYAEFLEYGTGKAHTGHGRDGYWFYKDRDGNWHMTDGMDAKPFIEPAVAEVMGDLNDLFADLENDIKKYRGWEHD